MIVTGMALRKSHCPSSENPNKIYCNWQERARMWQYEALIF